MKNNKEALVILSGGMDSTTLLYQVVQLYGNDNVLALSFNYGSNHSVKELPKAIRTCAKLDVEQQVIDITNIFKEFHSSLLEGAQAIPEGHYAQENMKSTVVPFRNGILLALAVAYAENLNIKEVYYGAHGGDHAIYPDCTTEFQEAMSMASKAGTYNKVRIKAPFNKMNKISILKKGIKLNVNYKDTWTCYKGLDLPCGKCGSCIERTEAFIKNNLQDPLYNKKEWEEAVNNYNNLLK